MTDLMRVTAVDYTTIGDGDDEEPVLKLTGRDEHAARRVHWVYGTRPHMYVREGVEPPAAYESRVVEETYGFETFDGVPVKRWDTLIPKDVRDLKKELDESWESDIPYYRRASIDYDLSGYVRVPDEKKLHIDDVETGVRPDAEDTIEPRVVYGDIEVLPDGTDFEEMVEEASCPVTAITLYDTHEEAYDVLVLDPEDEVVTADVVGELEEHGWSEEDSADLRRYDSEEELLDGFLAYFERVRPDLTTGWNWVGFDVLYLLRRIKRLHTDDNDLDLNRLSDAGGVKRNFRDYHGSLARAVIGVPAVDMQKLFFERIEYTEWRSEALDYVAQQVVGHGKVEGMSVVEGYNHQRSRFVAYNVVDVMLCVEIDEERAVLDTCWELAEESQVQIYDVFSEMRLVDGYIMARADDDEVLPAMPEDADIPENAGGLVLEPAEGISEWVGVMDLKSLYPSAMITWNISPETVEWTENMDGEPDMKVPWVPEASDIGAGKRYEHPLTADDIDWDRLGTSLDEEGLIPKYLKLLFKNREEAKAERDSHDVGSSAYETWDRRQYGIKVLMNSFYGVSSNDHWRLGKHGLGDAITSAARYALFKGKQVVERVGYDTIYGDTDSVFFSLAREDAPTTEEGYKKKALLDGKGLTNQVNDSMKEAVRESGLEGDHPFLDGELPHDAGSHCLKYEFEKLYRRYIQFGKKKRYAGLIVWKEGKDVDKVDITGFEAQRSDTPELAAEAQEEVLHKVLGGEGFEGVSAYVSGLCKDIEESRVPLARIARPKSLGKPMSEYDTVTQTVKACRASADQLGMEWREGSDPFLVFLKSTPLTQPSVSVIALDWHADLPDGYEVDVEEHIRICLEAPLRPILDELGWTWREVRSGALVGSAMDGDWGGTSSDSTEAADFENSQTQDGGGVNESDWGERDEDDESSDESGSSGGALEADW